MNKIINLLYLISFLLTCLIGFFILQLFGNNKYFKTDLVIKKDIERANVKLDSIFIIKDTLVNETLKKNNQIILDYEKFENKTNNTKFTDVFLDSFLSELKKRAKLQGIPKK